MAENSNIEWTHHTANLWQGCTRVHRGCDNCYAARLSARWGKELWDKLEDGTPAPRMYVKAAWGKFKKWQNQAAADRTYHRIFVGSMMDIFEKSMPVVMANGERMTGPMGKAELTTNSVRSKFFSKVVPSNPNLMFLLLTKRSSNILKMIPGDWMKNQPRNVMYGASIVDNDSLRTVGRHLGAVEAVGGRTFWSVEPLLEELTTDHLDWATQTGKPKWVIVGGESGPGRRPFNPEWARTIRDWCEEHGIAFFMKQWDKVQEVPLDLQVRQFPYWHDFNPKL